MKALKYRGTNSSAFLAASLATTLGCLGINSASAQSDDNANTQVDMETCQALSDSTALDQDSIKTRIACYSRDVEHLNKLVSQLTTERDALIAEAESQSGTVDEFKLELARRQDAMQRLEERAANLKQQLDEVSADRNNVREQLFTMIAEGKDQPVEVEANKILFENFSESYVSLTSEIEDLRKRLQEFESANTSLSDQQLATQIENQQLQSDQKELNAKITSLEESVASLQAEKETLEADLNNANNELDNIKSQLAANEETAQQQLEEIARLKTSLQDSESQRVELESTIASLNEKHLNEITELNKQTDILNSEIEALGKQQLALEEASTQSSAEIEALAAARKELNAERETLIAQITTLEKSHLEQTQRYKDEAGNLENQITSLASEKSELSLQLQDQLSENEELKAYAKQSDEKNTKLSIASDQLRQRLNAANTVAGNLQATVDKLGDQSASDKAMFDEQLAKLNSTIEQSQKERASLTDELDAIKPQLQNAEENLLASEKQNESLLANVAELEQSLKAATEEQQDLKNVLLETENKSKQANESLAALKQNAETLTSLLAMSKAHSENADAALAELRAEMAEADNNLQQKQAELAALLAEKTSIESEFKALATEANTQAAAIEKTLQDAGHDAVKVSVSEENNIEILLGSGQLFRTGSTRLSSKGQNMLSDLAKTFEQATDRRIMISGHSDNVPLGSMLAERFKDNWGLSLARALATADFLVDNAGITADRMTVSGLGATQPLADNDTEEGRQQNRRVEILLVPAGDTMASAE